MEQCHSPASAHSTNHQSLLTSFNLRDRPAPNTSLGHIDYQRGERYQAHSQETAIWIRRQKPNQGSRAV